VHIGLGDLDSAATDLRELLANYATGVEPAVRQGWSKRLGEVTVLAKEEAHVALGVERFATATEIRKAYRQACLLFHPDKHASSTDDVRTRAKHKFNRIQEAYERLTANAGGAASEYMRNQRQQSYARPSTAHNSARGPGRANAQTANAWWRTEDSFEGDEEDDDDDDGEPPGYVPGRKQWDSPRGWASGYE